MIKQKKHGKSLNTEIFTYNDKEGARVDVNMENRNIGDDDVNEVCIIDIHTEKNDEPKMLQSIEIANWLRGDVLSVLDLARKNAISAEQLQNEIESNIRDNTDLYM